MPSVLHVGTCTHGENLFLLRFFFTQVPDFVKSYHAANFKEVSVLHFSFQKREVGPDDAEYAFPEVVLKYIRTIAPGDVKGEIREVCLSSIHSILYFLYTIKS